MFGKKKQKPQIDQDQLALFKNAQRRVKQKKGVYIHFVVFLIGAIILIVANTVLGIAKDFKPFEIDWFVLAILAWLFFFLYHAIKVFVLNKFMGKQWEKEQIEKLIAKQQDKIDQLQKKLVAPTKEELALKNKMKKNNLTIIVAADEANGIGKNNDLIWHLKNDLKRFKALTSGHHIIMGRKTFESFPKPLPNRTHIVITRQKNYQVPVGVLTVNSLEEAIDAARSDEQPFIIGGGEIYKQAIPFASKIELTRVHDRFEADTFFPLIDYNDWKEVESIKHEKDEDHKHAFTFLTLEKR